MKRKALLISIIGVLLLLCGTIYILLNQTIKDSNEQKQLIKNINDNYEKFKTLTENFTNERTIMYENLFNDLYVETIYNNYNNWYLELEKYNKTILEIKKYEDFLNSSCKKDEYINSNLKSKCESMLMAYETAINYYVKDINKFNDIVNKYNSGVEDELKLEVFNLNGMNYIDFNDDSNYVGK